jgi:hypothetical protein
MTEARNNSPNVSANKTTSPSMSAGDANVDAEEDAEKGRLEKRLVARFKLSALLSGWLFGLFVQLSIFETKLLRITFWEEHHVTKSKTIIVVFSLSWISFTAAMVIKACCLTFGCFRKLPENRVFHMIEYFGLGALISWELSYIWVLVLGYEKTPTECALAMLVIALLWYKMEMMFVATLPQPSSRRSKSEETMTAV